MLNSLAAIGVALELELDDAAVVSALAEFQGIDRRMQILGEVPDQRRRRFVRRRLRPPSDRNRGDPAGRASAGWPDRRVVLIFQPHRYTRTHELLDDFAEVLSGSQPLFVTEVYAAGEEAIAGADGRAICRAIRARGQVEPVFVPDLDELPQRLSSVLADGDLVLTLGAGNIGAVATTLPASMEKLASLRARR